MSAPSDRPIYLDHNATTPVHPEVRDAMLPWLGDHFGNPSSQHAYGRDAAGALARARGQVASLIGAEPASILFTSGGTEADNLAILGTVAPRNRLVLSAVEHPAVEEAARVRESQGWSVDRLPVDARGRIDLEHATPLDEPTGLVSVILAQNETGTIEPVAEVCRRARAAASDVVVHTDAAQAVGKIPVDVSALGIDLLTIVSHKFYGPCGIGALFIGDRAQLEPLMHGGGQGGGLRPGTEPMPLIVGLGAACALAKRTIADESVRASALRELLWSRLHGAVPDLVRTAGDAEVLPNTLHVCFPGRVGSQILAGAPEIAASTGSACHAHDEAVSGTLGAMGFSAATAMGAIRLSLGRSTTATDVERAAIALIDAAKGVDVVSPT